MHSCEEDKAEVQSQQKVMFNSSTLLYEALLGVNSDKRHGLEPATWEPRTGDYRQTIATN